MSKIVKLNQIKEGSKIEVGFEDIGKRLLTFHFLEGSKSFCSTENGEVARLHYLTPLEMGEDGVYRINEEL